MLLRIVSVFVIFSLLLSCSKLRDCDCSGRETFPTSVLVTEEKAKTIADVICRYVNDENVPCIQVSIIDSLGNVWTLTTGTTDVKRKQPASDDNLLRLASITKTITATVIYKLIEQGSLTLDDKLIKYYPDFTGYADVTIANLLDHSSGIRDILTLPDILSTSTLFTNKIWDINAIMKTMADKKPLFTAGSDHQYSNTNFILLGLIAEKITQREMTELYSDYVFAPLNITKIYLVPQSQASGQLISGFDRRMVPTPGLYEVTPQNTSFASAVFTAGALIGNSEEACLFYHNLFAGKIVSSASLTDMTTFKETIKTDNEYLRYFGRGLLRFEINNKIYFGHSGLFAGFDNIAGYRTTDKISIVIISNISTYSKYELLKEIDVVL